MAIEAHALGWGMRRIVVFVFALLLSATVAVADRYEDCKQEAELDRTIRGCTEIIDRGKRETAPQRRYAHSHRGMVYRYRGDLDRAIADFSQSVQIDPTAIGYFDRGDAYLKKGEYDRAIADFNRAIEIKPDAEWFYYRGLAYSDKKDSARAIADFTKAITIRPSASYYEDRGLTYARMGERDRAIADFTRSIEIRPSMPKSYFNRGLAYEDMGEIDRAIADYTKTIETGPDEASDAFDASMFLLDPDAFDYADEMDWLVLDALNNRGVLYQRKKDFDRALADYDKAIEYDADYPLAYGNRCQVYLAKGKLDRASADCTKAIELAPKSAYAHAYMGEVHKAKGEHALAIAEYRKALEINPELSSAKRSLAALEQSQTANANGATPRATASEQDASSGGSKELLAACKDVSNTELTLSACTKLIEGGASGETLIEAYSNRGETYLYDDQFDKALADYDKAIELDPKNAWAYLDRANAFDYMEKPKRAAKDLSKVIELDPKGAAGQLASDMLEELALGPDAADAPKKEESAEAGGQRPGNAEAKERVAAERPSEAADIAFWNSVKESNDATMLQAYLEKFPNGVFSSLAKLKLEKLQSE